MRHQQRGRPWRDPFALRSSRRNGLGCPAGPLHCRSEDTSFNGALYTVLVADSRPLSGESGARPRVIGALPFSDSGDTSKFLDDYSCSAQVRS